MSIEAKKQKRNDLISQLSTLVAKGVRSVEDKKSFADLNTAIEILTEDLEMLATIQSKRQAIVTEQTDTRAAQEAAHALINAMTPEQRRADHADAIRAYIARGEHRDILTTNDGSVLVPQSAAPVLQQVAKHYFPVLEKVNVIESTNGRPVQVIVEDGTAVFLSPQAEGVAPAETDASYSDQFLAHDLVSGAVKASWQLFNDSKFDLTDVIPTTGGKQLARTLDFALFAGTDVAGHALPHNANMISAVSAGATTTALAGGIGESDLSALVESVDSSYWTDSVFVMNGSTYLNLLQQKDGMGRRYWKELAKMKLWNWDVLISNALPSIAVNTTPVMFGALSNVTLSYTGLGVQRLSERYIDNLQFGFMLSSRIGSKLMVPAAVKSLQIAAS